MPPCGGGSRSRSDRSRWLSIAHTGLLAPPGSARVRQRRGRCSKHARLIADACLDAPSGSASKVDDCPLTVQEAGGFAATSRRRTAVPDSPRTAPPSSAATVRLRPTAQRRTYWTSIGRRAMAEAKKNSNSARPPSDLQPRDYQAALFEEAKTGNVSAPFTASMCICVVANRRKRSFHGACVTRRGPHTTPPVSTRSAAVAGAAVVA